MNNQSYFAQKLDHSEDYIGQIYLDKRFNAYDIYTFCEDSIRIYHYPVYTEYDNMMNRDIIGDKYIVQQMVYNDSTGCIVGTQLTYGTFDNIEDAVDCGRDVQLEIAIAGVA